ncbi:unnamed protein product [Orchesella dallaii]|uniref:SCP domain-containing protein n=1 Tax=Orchesella dallaii TaxID=48710 RepID=A0ABP1PLS2_9HEXA
MGRSSSTRMALWTILLAASPLLASSADIQYGIDTFAKAGRGACWVEKLHKLPPIDDQGVNYGTCDGNLRFKDNEWQKQYDFQADFQRKNGNNPDTMKAFLEGAALNNLKRNMKQKFGQLPSVYRSTCEKFIDNEKETPATDYSSILQDSSHGDYPFKALAHCILGAIEQTNGAEDLAALKSHMLSPKPFQQAIIDRENENRARHGVPLLKLDAELNTRAQRYADELARICKMVHMSKNPKYGENHPDLQYNGGKTGENLAENGAIQLTDNEASVAGANGWYSEIKDYPWPAWTGGPLRGVIGHFTASVWKSTQLAGYGFGKRDGCNKVFVVARYSPGGNMQSAGMPAYKENVLPPL